MGIADTSIAAIAAALSGAAAVASWRSSRDANRTAASVAQIERDRWHRELTPRLEFRVDADNQILHARFLGPAELGLLQVRLTVRDDRDRSQDAILAGSYTREMRDRVIWGPFQFRHGRDAGPVTFDADDRTRLAIDPSMRPEWYEGADGERRWRTEHEGRPLRLWATCEASGHKPWRLSCEVPYEGNPARTQAPAAL
ncbi:hypothetical protein AB0O01_36030 [Streptomyces sp. NPDC093252]|uniref:hypothetical protein n=1 Tax=Streptomyces sp. NPDC093252 TaxID=3154980 RepID=UPI003432C0B9